MPSGSRFFATRPASSHADPLQRLFHRGFVHVREDDRDLEPAQEERRELGCHQAGADDADACDSPGRRLGNADTALGAALDEVEGVDGRLRLWPRQQLCQGVLLGAVALLERPLRRAGDQLEGPVRRRRGTVHRIVHARARTCARPPPRRRDRPAREAGSRTRSRRAGTRSTRRGTRPARAARPRSPASKACGPVSIRFCRSGCSTTNFTAVSAPTSRGTSCVPPQPGISPRKTSGQAKWRTPDEIVRKSQARRQRTK